MNEKDRILEGTGAIRLNVTFDPDEIAKEVEGLEYVPAPSRHPRNHHAVLAFGLRKLTDGSYQDAPGIDERLPKTRALFHELLPGTPHRALLGQLAPASHISIHSDRGAYFEPLIRTHFVIRSNPKVRFYARGQFYEWKPGEIWVLANLVEHGVLNDHPTESRLHLVTDYDQTPGMLQLLREGDRDLGVKDDQELWRLHQLSRASRREYPSVNAWYETQQFFQDAKRAVSLRMGRMLRSA